MKVGFTQAKAISTATQGAGAVGGMLVSKVGMGVAPSSLRKPLPRLILGAIILVGASTITGKGAGFDLAKGLAFGAGAQQVAEGFAGIIKPSVESLAEGSKVKSLAEKSLHGLGSVEEPYKISAGAWENAQPMAQQSAGFAPA